MDTEEQKEYTLPYELELRSPVEVGSETIEKITFKNEPDGDMVGSLPAGGKEFFQMQHFYPIISKMTGESSRTVRKMKYADLQVCLDVVSYFLGDGQETGTK